MRRLAGHLILVCLIAATCRAETDSRIPIAVLDLTGQDISASQRQTFSDRLRHELFATGKFRVMERERMMDILKEQAFQLSGCTSTECAVEVGQLVGVQRIVAGSLSKLGTFYSVSIRLTNVETGEIERTAVQDCRCSIEEVLTKALAEVAARLMSADRTKALDLGGSASANSRELTADSLLRAGAYADAILECERVLLVDATDKRAWLAKGIALTNLGRHAEAVSCFDQSLEIDEDYKEAWVERAFLFFYVLGPMGRATAFTNISQAIAIDPGDASLWRIKGIWMFQTGRYAEALAALDRALIMEPHSWDALHNRAAALGALGRFEEALAGFEQCLILEPSDAVTWYNKGVVLANLGRKLQAIEAFERAVALYPDHRDAWFNRGLVLRELGRHEEAVSCFEAAQWLGHPDSQEAIEETRRLMRGR